MENREINWGEVVDFFSKKYIITRPSFTGSSVEIDGNKLNVTLGNKGKFLLLQKNVDKTVSDFIFNTTGNRYEVEFFEPENDNFAISRDQYEENIIKNMLDENIKRAQEAQLQKNNEELKKKEQKARNKIEKQVEDSTSYANIPGPSDEELSSLLASVDNARMWEVNSSGVVEVSPSTR